MCEYCHAILIAELKHQHLANATNLVNEFLLLTTSFGFISGQENCIVKSGPVINGCIDR